MFVGIRYRDLEKLNPVSGEQEPLLLLDLLKDFLLSDFRGEVCTF